MKKKATTCLFKSPLSQTVGDIFILIVIVLFYTLGLTMVFGFLIFLILEPAEVVLILKVCLIPSFIISLIVRIRRLNWQIVLKKEKLFIGISGLKKKIDYDQIFFISHGSLPERLYKEKENKIKPVTSVIIEYQNTGKTKILLHTDKAMECFHYLVMHCPNAAGVDMDNKEYLTKESSSKKGAIKRLKRKKIFSGYGSIVIGVLCILLAYFGVNEYQDAVYYIRAEILRIIAFITGTVWIGFGVKTLR